MAKLIDDGLKQRVIGAIVLLAIAVIFIPVLFDRPTITPVDQTTQVPPMPEIVLEPIPVAEPPVVDSPAPEPEAMLLPDPDNVADLKPEPPSLNAHGVPKSWVLQVISYRDKAQADHFRDQLIAKGFTAFTRVANTSDGSRYRVFVGPRLDKRKILEDKRAIDDAFQVKSMVLDMTPEAY